MTTRNLHTLFRPKSVAVIGASNRASSIGRVLMQNLLHAGPEPSSSVPSAVAPVFCGPIMPVNPKHDTVLGVRAYPDVDALPFAPDLAVIAVAAARVPALVEALAELGTRGIVIISAGLGQRSADGRTLQQAVLDAARPKLVRVVGPNSLGILVPAVGLNASFAHLTPPPGDIAFLAQSGAITTSVLDWAFARGIGFSHALSLGDMADVDFGDLLDYLANDSATRAILLYVEVITQARKFMSAARAASRMKPVIVVKSGRHESSGRAAASHTGRLAGPDAEYAAAFRRAGMLRVAALEELFDAVETLALARPPRGRRLAILSNGGGTAVLAADALLDLGGKLAQLSPQTLERLDTVLPANWSRANPIDIVGDATAQRYAQALDIVLEDSDLDGVLILHCPTAIAPGPEAARAVIATVKRYPDATVLTSWLGEQAARASRTELQQHRVPTYETPEQAVRAFMQMVDYRRNQELLIETPPSLPELFVADAERAREVIDRAAAGRRAWLTDAEAKDVLAAYGVPVTRPLEAATPVEAGAAAAKLGVPVVLKVVAQGILHKSDAGGVALGLSEPAAVEAAASAMLERVRAARPDVEITGFGVEPMIERPRALQLIVGASSGGDFGPVILFGHGGTAVEVIDDTAVELPPLNLRLARGLIERTRVFRQMRGYRDVPAVDLDAVALALTRVSQLLVDCPQIIELDINPLLADEHGVVAVDARIKIDAEPGAAASRLAIRPYPKELEQDVQLADGRVLLLRPILPEDEPALQAGFEKLTPEEIRARFFVPLKTLSHVMAARFTQIDYDREMALALTEHGIPGKAEIFGVVRMVADPDNRAAEFAVIVERRFTGLGFGMLLMHRIIDYARARGVAELFGDVLADNARMRRLCKSLGFSESFDADTPGVVRVRLALDPPVRISPSGGRRADRRT
jgi:acetyltransferase